MADDYYNVLNVSRTASQEEIQKSYRRLARKFHPDLHADEEDEQKDAAKQKFQKIQQAYDVLSDPEKRQMYDQLGPEFDRRGGQSPFGNAGGSEFDFSQIFGAQAGRAGGFEDLLRQFGMGAGGPGPMKGGTRSGPFQRPPGPATGPDVEQQITVPFSTAILGGEYRVTLERRSGKVETIDVKIPAGIESGKKIRLRGQGSAGFDGGSRGDLLIQVKISPHPSYSRKGLNLIVTLPITLGEAVRGAKIDLPTPHGTITVTVPPGAASGKALRLKGMGIKGKDLNGDLIATLQIVLPKNLSAQDIQLIEKLDAGWNGTSPRIDLTW